MRLPKFLILSFIITSFSLLYVRQQTEIFRLAYDNQKNLALFMDLLDENSNLRYNLKRDTSLVRINSKVFSYNDFKMPDVYCLLRQPGSPEGQEGVKKEARRFSKKKNFLSSIFSLRKEAEARTILP